MAIIYNFTKKTTSLKSLLKRLVFMIILKSLFFGSVVQQLRVLVAGFIHSAFGLRYFLRIDKKFSNLSFISSIFKFWFSKSSDDHL